MQVQVFDNARRFAEVTRAYLIAHEAEHNLLFGITSSIISGVGFGPEPPLMAIVEDAGQVAAVAVQTPPRNIVLSLMSDGAVDALAAGLLGQGRRLPGVLAPTRVARRFADRWCHETGLASVLDIAERAYQVSKVTPPVGVSGSARLAIPADRQRVIDMYAAFQDEALSAPESTLEEIATVIDHRLSSEQAGILLWEDGGLVSLAGFGGPTPNGMRIGPVYTPPPFRGRGYASAVTAAASKRILDEGRDYVFLFTNLANATANKIYQQIGYEPVIDVDVMVFRPPA